MGKTYQKIAITDRSYGTVERKPARKVSDRLAVSYSHMKYDHVTFKIFSIVGQRHILDVRFSDVDEACIAAELIEDAYDHIKEPEINYFDIWESDPELEVLAIARYTIPNGIEIYKNFKALEDREPNIVSLDDIKRALGEIK